MGGGRHSRQREREHSVPDEVPSALRRDRRAASLEHRGEDREANSSQGEIFPVHFGFESIPPMLVCRINKAPFPRGAAQESGEECWLCHSPSGSGSQSYASAGKTLAFMVPQFPHL